jgi:hypothetical protein
MRNIILTWIILCGVHAHAAFDKSEIESFPDGTRYLSDKIVVVEKTGVPSFITGEMRDGYAHTGIESVDGICEEHNIVSVEPLYRGILRKSALSRAVSRIFVFTVGDGVDPFQVIPVLQRDPSIRTAEPYIVPELHYEPNDPYLFQQWYFPHTQTIEAWDIVRGDTTRHSIIAIIDTGIDREHEDLGPNIWINDLEDINGNGVFDPGDINYVDDDGNGFVDDVAGWDFGDGDNDPSEDQLHGSAVASVASEATDNEILGAGMGFSARLMALKANSSSGAWNGYECMIYAADNGAQVINCSWGMSFYSQYEQDIINAVWAEDVLVIASAGANSNDDPEYPAAYDHVMAVTATDQNDHKAYFAGFGEWVDICAPGIEIKVISGDEYQTHNGTSYSCAMASGLAALVRAWYPDYSNDEAENLIKESAEPIDHLNPGYEGMLGSGRINAYNCFETTGIDDLADTTPSSIDLRSSPNPFNASTSILYSLPESRYITVDIYNLLGQRVVTIYEGVQEAGEHPVVWDASAFRSGVYFARLEAGGRSKTVKMVLLR